jgi:hypothetical protein
MNFTKSALLLLFMAMTQPFHAQYVFENPSFDDTKIEIPAIFADEKEITLKRDVKIQFVQSEKGVSQFYFIHEKTYINSDDAIERNNRVYIPYRSSTENLVVNKLRVILKSGKIISLDNKDIKEEIDEERKISYQYYAVNGLEKGCIVEKIFIKEQAPKLDGTSIDFQTEIPTVQTTFELIFPNHLIFKHKSYNELEEAVYAKEKHGENASLMVKAEMVVGLNDDEKYANREVNLKQFRYKLDENLANGAKNIYQFKSFASDVYENIFTALDKKTDKSISEFIKKIKVEKDELKQIQAIENHIKSSIGYNNYFNSNKTLADVFNSKQANQVEIIKIYIAVLKKFNIKTELVFTSSRFDVIFDPEFESYENLRDVLLYFPNSKMFLEPHSFEYRTPLFNHVYGNNYGLFVKEKEFGGAKMGIGSLEFIEIPNDITHDFMNIVIDFTEDLNNPIVHTKIEYGGYAAVNFQPLKEFMPLNQYNDILKQIAENYTLGGEVLTLETQNDGIENIGKKRFVLDLKFEGNVLTQKAGPNILFKLGETIGRQMEFYQDEKRVQPVEIDYPHYYTRKITLKIPKGYKIKGLESANMNFDTKINDQIVAKFESKVKITDSTLVVDNEEFYSVIHYPLEVYESYKKVINAAADFNKIVVILEKE